MNSLKISFVLPSFEDGGVEKVTLNIARGFLKKGYLVEIVCFQKTGTFLADVPKEITIHELGSKRALSNIPAMIKYFKEQKPDIVISAKHYVNTAVLLAKQLSFTKSKVIVAGHGMYNQAKSSPLVWLMQMLYKRADAIVAVSEGVAKNIAEISKVNFDNITVIHNPVITEEFVKTYEATAEIEKNENQKLLLSIGRLAPEKDFTTLIEAIHLLHQRIPCKLIILGEGPERQKIEEQIKKYNLEQFVDLPGFKKNPLSYLKSADAFVLSSITEGLPTVLIEALYCNVPIVSTDCPSGPNEILLNGKYGILTPVGDAAAISKGLEKILENGWPENLQSRAKDFTSQKAIEKYEKLIHYVNQEYNKKG